MKQESKSVYQYLYQPCDYSKLIMKATDANSKSEKIEPVKVSKQMSMNDKEWMNKYQGLKEFKEKHGHTYVERDWPVIGKWVRRQGTLYKKGTIRPDRKKLLDEIDFLVDYNEKSWDEHFEVVRKKSEEVKHCDIPHSREEFNDTNSTFEDHMPWAREQRLQYVKHMRGWNSRINPRRIKKLNSIGFTWKSEKFERLASDSHFIWKTRRIRQEINHVMEEVRKARHLHEMTGDFVIPLPFGKYTISVAPDGTWGLEDLQSGDSEKKIFTFGELKEGVNAQFSRQPTVECTPPLSIFNTPFP